MCADTAAGFGELKPLEYGGVVAAERYTVEGTLRLQRPRGRYGRPDAEPPAPPSAKLVLELEHGVVPVTTIVKADGSWALLEVPPGTHMLHVAALGYVFPVYRIDVSAKHHGRTRISFAEDKRQVLEEPFVLEPYKEAEYFEPRQEFSIASLFKNPMYLMMAVSIVMMFLLPKMMENMDPEELKQMQERMAAMQSGGGGFSEALKQAQAQQPQQQRPAGGGRKQR